MKKLITFSFIILILSSCTKEEGEGGNSSIRGNIRVRDFNAEFTAFKGTFPGADEEVMIIYGDEIAIGDRIRTNFNGDYEFKYLREGNYKVYVYSRDSAKYVDSGNPDATLAIIKDVQITDKKQVVTIPEILIYK